MKEDIFAGVSPETRDLILPLMAQYNGSLVKTTTGKSIVSQ